MFDRILIANRGEIALRIIRACKEMGIKTVAVYSTADEQSLHVQTADEAICIGPAPSRDSYLKIANIISAAEVADVDAIHPGYGFLAENAHMAEICENCKITFIGPTPDNIRLMGDKSKARETMKKAGIPVTPGSEGIIETKEEALEAAREIGYPVLIKAVAGGGGKGMRIAHNDVSLVQGFMTASSEAERAFGNAAVYLEKFVEKARHIEVQIVGDHYGNVVHLGERDCSIQRRHQKLLEESPSPALSHDMRKKLARAAVRGAESVRYRNAGTIEFLYDEEINQFYFMEMNTRIQVEHPVTEEVTGIDLIQEQISIAAGNRLSFNDKDLRPTGHAIEFRINAEDPYKDFTPSPGKVTFVHFPGGPGVRIDSHVYSGYEISSHYDSMIGKLIVYGRTRKEAIAKMSRALGEFILDGAHTTVPLGQALLGDARFARGEYNTTFLDTFMKEVFLITP
jgi:acetyl-CoA carboxylase, biotin carboxylase subunit